MIDMPQMLKEERARQSSVIAPLKTVRDIDFHNMLQDLRHIVIIDFRSQESVKESGIFLRGSFIHDKTKADSFRDMFDFFKEKDEKAKTFEEKYDSKKVRRCFIIDDFEGEITDTSIPSHFSEHHQTMATSLKSHDIHIDKFYCLKFNLQEFKKRFSFLCISIDYVNIIRSEKDLIQEAKITKNGITPTERQYLLAHSRYPFIMVDNDILLGNVFNSNNEQQMKDMGVKSMVNITFVVDIEKDGTKVNEELVKEMKERQKNK